MCSKAINAALTLGAKVLGLVENMSAYTCRCCGDTVNLFGKDKGQGLARMMEVPFLGSIPIDPLFSESADAGVPIVNLHPESVTARAFVQIAETLAGQMAPKSVPDAPVEESKPCPGSGHRHHHHKHHDHGAPAEGGCGHRHHHHHG